MVERCSCGIEHRASFCFPVQVRMRAGPAETLVVSRNDGEPLFQPIVDVLAVARAMPAPGWRAPVGAAKRAVRPGNKRPSALWRGSLRKIKCAAYRNDAGSPSCIRRSVQDSPRRCGRNDLRLIGYTLF